MPSETIRPARARAAVRLTRAAWPAACAWVCVEIGRPQAGRRDVRVDLGRGQALVTEQLLDDAQVGAPIEQVRCERVAERVRRHALGQAGATAQEVEPVAQPADAERLAAVVQEQLGRRWVIGAPPRAAPPERAAGGRPPGRPSIAARAGRPSSPIRSLRPLP